MNAIWGLALFLLWPVGMLVFIEAMKWQDRRISLPSEEHTEILRELDREFPAAIAAYPPRGRMSLR